MHFDEESNKWADVPQADINPTLAEERAVRRLQDYYNHLGMDRSIEELRTDLRRAANLLRTRQAYKESLERFIKDTEETLSRMPSEPIRIIAGQAQCQRFFFSTRQTIRGCRMVGGGATILMTLRKAMDTWAS